MKLNYLILATLAAIALTVGACAPQAAAPAAAVPSPAAQAAPSSAPVSAAPATAAVVTLGKSDALGAFLVDEKGMALYLYTKDTPGTSVCTDKCAVAWPPLLTAGSATAGDGVDASKLGTTTRADGSTQVTYNGWPLYYFDKDKQAGDTTGQGVGGVWYLLSGAGDAVGKGS
jgi:predicted lipoprotein with Yx(FWY)xxD motif